MSEMNIVGVDLSGLDYTAGDVTRLAGLSYRQINDWDERAGVTDSGRDSAEGWRKYTFAELVALCVCAKLREELHIPLDKVGVLYRWLIKPVERKMTEGEVVAGIEMIKGEFKKSHARLPVPDIGLCRQVFEESSRKSPIQMAVEQMDAGEPFYLSTDFTTSLICNEQLLKAMFDRHFAAKPTVLFLLNPVLNKVLKDLGIKATAFRFLNFTEVMAKLRAAAEEQEILGLIQNREFHTVTLRTNQGRVIRAECTESIPPTEVKKRWKQIIEAVDGGDFSTVTVQKADGQVVKLERKTIVKFGKVAGKH